MTTTHDTRTDVWDDLLRQVRTDVDDQLKYLIVDEGHTFDELDDWNLAHEVADAAVPVYTYDIAQLVAAKPSLLIHEAEIGPAADHWGVAGRWVVAAIYERLHDEALRHLEEIAS